MPPNYHWFPHGQVSDHQRMRNVEIYDLLLHKRDVPFSISDLYEWTEKGGYNLVDFSLPKSRALTSPEMSIRDNLLHKKIKRQNRYIQHWVGEVMSSFLFQHNFYVSKNENSEASMDDEENRIFADGSPVGFPNVLDMKSNEELIRNKTFISGKIAYSFIDTQVGPGMASRLTTGKVASDFILPSSKLNKFVITELTKRPLRPHSVKDLLKAFKDKTKSNHSISALKQSFKDLFTYLKITGLFFLKRKSVELFPKTCCHNRFRVLGKKIKISQNVL